MNTTRLPRIHILYLASGNSRRFGENKLMASLHGKPLFRWGMDLLIQCIQKHDNCTLTVVSRYPAIRQAALAAGLCAADSPDSEKGISYTIRSGLSYVMARHFPDTAGDSQVQDYLMFVVADQPHLTLPSVEKLLICAEEGCETASLAFGERPGNPTLFSAELLPELLALTGDQGGRAVIKKHACRYVQACAERELFDIDRKEDLGGSGF